MRVAYEISLQVISFTGVAARIMEELSRLSCVRGYHIYQDVWDAGYCKYFMRLNFVDLCDHESF